MGKTADDDGIVLLNPNTGREDVRIKKAIYEPVRQAILEALGETEELRLSELPEQVEQRTPKELWKNASTIWFTTAIKLHLEATELLERSGSPQVISLTEKGRAALKS